MNPKIAPDHLGRAAVVYIRQSTLAQVVSNLESQRRQYALVEAAKAAGFASISVRVHGKAAVQKSIHHRPVRHLNRHRDRAWVARSRP